MTCIHALCIRGMHRAFVLLKNIKYFAFIAFYTKMYYVLLSMKEIFMKKTYTKLALTLAIFCSASSFAFADGNAFTPLNFDDSAPVSKTTPVATPEAATAAPKASSNPISDTLSKILPKKDAAAAGTGATAPQTGEVPIGNDNIQNAILELDNAQVGIRNDLLNYKAKYADVDAQYKLIKNERNMLNNQIKTIERRIKNIDRAKEKIRKNMI